MAQKNKMTEKMRPTTGKVRSALFSILMSMGLTRRARFLDLFAGSGRISMAAVLHGASEVVAVEADRTLASWITGDDRIEVLAFDVRRALPKLLREGRMFDVIFADPPYELGWSSEMASLISANAGLLMPWGAFVLEHSVREAPPLTIAFGEMVVKRSDRVYGETVLSIYKIPDEEPDEDVVIS